MCVSVIIQQTVGKNVPHCESAHVQSVFTFIQIRSSNQNMAFTSLRFVKLLYKFINNVSNLQAHMSICSCRSVMIMVIILSRELVSCFVD